MTGALSFRYGLRGSYFALVTLAFAEVLLLWALIIATLLAFRRLQIFAAVLLVPYLAWVSFAAALTLSTWNLNPDLL